MEALQETARVVTSKSAKRAVVNIIFLFTGALTLLFFAAVGSALFFQSFVPHQVLSKPVHLQYGSGLNPFGVVSLASPTLKSAQDYDVSVSLSMPPSPPNMERGNFMLTLHLFDEDVSVNTLVGIEHRFEGRNIVFSSRRPTLVPYVDPIVSMASRVLFLFYHMLFPGSRTCEVTVPLAERVSFPKDSVVPASAYLEVESGQSLQTYQVSLRFTAQLRGLRWLMHHYRLPMYITLTFLFWVFEILFMALVWSFLFSATTTMPEEEGEAESRARGKGGKTRLLTKTEDDEDLSDHPHNFPTYGRQPPLKHEPEVKDEEHERPLSELPIGGAEADDEFDDEEDGGKRRLDSGIGTSYSEEGSGQLRRRASRQGD